MKKVYEQYLELVRMAWCENYIAQDMEQFNWDGICRIALGQTTVPVIYNGLWNKDLIGKLPCEVQKSWHDITVASAVSETGKLCALERFLDEAAKRGIKAVCFKGNIIARLYPEWKSRVSGDSDIFVYERDGEKAVSLLYEMGYEMDLADSKTLVPVFVHKETLHKIELHFSLWEDYEGSQIDILNAMGITNENDLIEVKIGHACAYTLSPTSHLIFQMFHIIKHFVVQGIGTRYMHDITCFINSHYNEIDFKRFWDSMEKLGYADFAVCYFGSCRDYLGLLKEAVPDERMNGIKDFPAKKEHLVADMISYSEKDKFDYGVITIMSPYLEGRESASGGGFKRKLRLIFPSPDALQDDFSYAKKHHILLPVAWVHKILRFLINRITKKSKSAGNKIKEADNRIAMMQEMNLL